MDDDVYKGCYIFKPSTPDEEDLNPRPRKKRKLSKKAAIKELENHDAWPRLFGGEESHDAAHLRKTLYGVTLANQKEKLDSIGHPFDERLVDSVLDVGSTDEVSKDTLRTCLLVSSLDAQQEFHNALERRLLRDSSKQNDILVHLQPSYCLNLQASLKTIIKASIVGHGGEEAYTDWLAEHKALIPMSFDLELLQRYMQHHQIGRILISAVDIETFDTSVLAELISTFHSWSDRISFMLVIGISTTPELFESRFPRAIVSLLDARIFLTRASGPGGDPLFKLYEKIQHDAETSIFFGPSVVNVIAEMAEDQGTTPDTLIRALTYLYMTHFFANPLSSFCVQSFQFPPPWDKTLSRAIRNIPSFKSYCDLLAEGDDSQRQLARKLLTSDKDLQTEAKEAIQSGQYIMRSSLRAIRTLRYIYHSVLRLDKYSLWESESILLSSLPRSTDSAIFRAIETTLRTRPNLAQSPTVLLDDSTTELDDLREYERTNLSKSSSTPAPETTLSFLRAYLRSRTGTTRAPTGSCSSPSPFRHFLAESYTITSKFPLSQIIHPLARQCTERALLQPADYLGCECCAVLPSSQGPSSPGTDVAGRKDEIATKASFPPTTLLFHMLSEAGAVINVRDLWDAFREVYSHSPDAESGVNGAGQDEDEDEDEEAVQERVALAQFYTALAELRYLGLIKQSKRKTKPGSGVGVECIQKTTWVGL